MPTNNTVRRRDERYLLRKGTASKPENSTHRSYRRRLERRAAQRAAWAAAGAKKPEPHKPPVPTVTLFFDGLVEHRNRTLLYRENAKGRVTEFDVSSEGFGRFNALPGVRCVHYTMPAAIAAARFDRLLGIPR